MELEFDVNITANTLYDYMLHHTYSSFSGILGGIIGVFLLIGFTGTGHILYLIAGLVVLFYLPWTLWIRSRKQALMNPAFKKPIHYKLTEEGIQVSQGEAVQSQTWEDMYKAVSTRGSIVVYTSRVNASIFPRKDLDELAPAVIEMISTHMPPGKVKIRF